jgi:hypothetical protein
MEKIHKRRFLFHPDFDTQIFGCCLSKRSVATNKPSAPAALHNLRTVLFVTSITNAYSQEAQNYVHLCVSTKGDILPTNWIDGSRKAGSKPASSDYVC